MEYFLVTATGKGIADSKQLNEAVNAKLKEGFELHGNPGLYIDSKTNIPVYFQAVIKKS